VALITLLVAAACLIAPEGIFAKVPGLGFGYRILTRVLPLGRAAVTERDGEPYLGG
jgi:3-phenylpropionate/trans-cinnamate dioxygenase ferredoxin component